MMQCLTGSPLLTSFFFVDGLELLVAPFLFGLLIFLLVVPMVLGLYVSSSESSLSSSISSSMSSLTSSEKLFFIETGIHVTNSADELENSSSSESSFVLEDSSQMCLKIQVLIQKFSLDTNHEENDSNDDNHRDNLDEMLHDVESNVDEKNIKKLQKLFVDAEKPLYNRCKKFTKVSLVVKLLDLKAKNNWSDKSFTTLIELLREAFPNDNELPVLTYQAKKLTCPMGLEVQRIHACPNDCILYRKYYKDQHECPVCMESRYKHKNLTELDSDVTKNGPPAKLLWYLPIIPILKKLYANPKDAKLLCWHAKERKNNRKMRHVANSPQWKNIDRYFKKFRSEIRNIQFGLCSDGINPFKSLSSRHSTWPILLCIYNLPPWLCMKQKYIMMSLFIQGLRQPGNDIDVYLHPLIDDMIDL
nr:hypothetical protein [Tanacetum cinerariifolium]